MTGSFRRIVGASCALLLIAACGSSDDSKDASPSTTSPSATSPASSTSAPASSSPDSSAATASSAAASSTTAAPTTAAPKKATGEPITVGFQWSQSGGAALPDVKSGADAALEYLNNTLGGINGRPLKLEACGTDGTPESSTICANNFKDAKVPTVIVSADPNEAVYPAILTQNGIPVLANSSTSVLLVTKGAHMMGSGALGTILDYAKYGQQKGYKKLLLIHIDNAGAAGVIGLTKGAFAKAGVEVQTLPIASGTADATPALQAAVVNPPDYIGVFSDATVCIAALKGIEVLGLKQDRVVTPTCTTPAVVEATGKAAVGAISFGNRVPGSATDPQAIAYRAALEKTAGKDVGPLGVAAIGFTAVMDIAGVLSTVPAGTDYTAESVSAAFDGLKDMPLFMSGGGTATCDGKRLPAPFVAVCSTFANAFRFDGTGQELLGPLDPSDLLGG
ncbi:MAG TPA: ABC transporter substrate-binding protein [Ilumatobacteraceae bacterium]|nr:ABC transporter substrate-binding protein [Ilumatobacteraceae bacterium]